jgi:ATP-dependent HslUV protease subunit HslV
MLLISGNGDVIEPDEGIVAIGSGAWPPRRGNGPLRHRPNWMCAGLSKGAMTIAASLCVFTNDRITIEEL